MWLWVHYLHHKLARGMEADILQVELTVVFLKCLSCVALYC